MRPRNVGYRSLPHGQVEVTQELDGRRITGRGRTAAEARRLCAFWFSLAEHDNAEPTINRRARL